MWMYIKAHYGLDMKQQMKKLKAPPGSTLVRMSHESNHGIMVVKQWRHSSDMKRNHYVLHGQQRHTEEESGLRS